MQQDPFRDTLPGLGQRRVHAEALLTHARNDNLGVENGVVHYVNRAKTRPVPIKLTGITRPLCALYWPSFTPFGHYKAGKGKKKASAPPEHRLLSMQALATGAVKGNIVHRQMGEYYTHDAKHFHMRNPSGLHHLGQVGLLSLLQNKFLPLRFEFPVACEAAYVGTPIDLVAVHEPTGKLAFFEVKTSSSRALFVHDDPATPFEGVLAKLAVDEPRSALTRARVQLGIAIQMLVLGHGLAKQDFYAFVLLLSEEGEGTALPTAELFEVDDTFLHNVTRPLYEDFIEQVPRWRAANKAEKKKARQ